MDGSQVGKVKEEVFSRLGIGATENGIFSGSWKKGKSSRMIRSISPIDGTHLCSIDQATESDYNSVVSTSVKAFEEWSQVPAPRRGEFIKKVSDALENSKKDLGLIVSLEIGKVISEGQGEIQEMIDIGHYALGLSRQLFGLTMASERPFHRMYEQWLPVGPVGVISAFNFPSSVWSWNSFIAAVCGDSVIWKPSSKAALSAIAVTKIVASVMEKESVPPIFSTVCGGGAEIGELLSKDPRIPVVSFTGSVATGKIISKNVAERLGRSILELGGNNGVIISSKADQSIAMKGLLFGALATAGQRCTTTRRAIIENSIYKSFTADLIQAYSSVNIGNPLNSETLVGPLIDESAVKTYQKTVSEAVKQGGKVLSGGNVLKIKGLENGYYVEPTIIEANHKVTISNEETFAPILYVFKYDRIEEAIRIHNSVPQGLSSAIFTNDIREEESFLCSSGSDCGIANVNTSTAGAEIGGAFGGEKNTGGGRESGSDAWKGYMRRQTVSKNYGKTLPLSQNVEFRLS